MKNTQIIRGKTEITKTQKAIEQIVKNVKICQF